MNYLIFVKHSLPEVVESLPANEWKLSEEGRTRAECLAERLRDFLPDLIVSSKEPKAKETAEIIARKLQLQLIVAENLHEHDRGNVPFLSKHEFQASLQKFFKNPACRVFGGETANQSHARFKRAVHTILNSYVDKTVVIITHGTVISLFVSRLTGISDLLLWQELGLPSFVVIDLQANKIIAKENIV
jgi:broad specificity phosphatase PhoE